jgi:hypothetical protein
MTADSLGDPILTIRAVPSYRDEGQVSVTRVTVNDRQEPAEPTSNGTQLAGRRR